LLKVKNTFSLDKFSLILWVKPDTLKIVKESRHIFRFFFRLKEHLSNKIEKNLPYPHQAILSALILGERQKLPSLIKDSFMRTGTVHILSISGLHVGMMVYIFYLFLKLLRFPRQISLFLLILFIIPYVILTGAKAPIVRAGIMSGVYLSGLILRREGNILNSLAIACWLILIFDPYQLFNAGFQLSFLGVLSIVLFTPLIENYFLREKEERVIFKKAHIKRYLFRLFAVSLSAWLGSSGLIGYYFKIINPIAILANIIVIPLSFFVLATGIIFLFSFSLFTSPLSTTNLLTIEILLKSVTFLSKIPGGTVSVTNFSFPLVILYYLCLGIITLVIKVRRKR
ncbi:MAG: ComEC/Rec2 family competence protein, partial [Candidatus Omnitrophica bacterium]|nr:ComEC/Rec2 family competence protein [Candidatus Omnitrophota bacterium]